MKKEQVVNCQFSVWYPIFKKHTIKSDHDTQTHSNSDLNGDLNAEEDIQWSDDETTTTVTAPEFPEFSSHVLEAINALGGSVFPKLNWSAPRDANWIALNSSLQCHSLSDIFLLFKSSDFITHDLTQPFLLCSDQDSPDPAINYELVLRKWSELIPGGEFRCFVKENKLIGNKRNGRSRVTIIIIIIIVVVVVVVVVVSALCLSNYTIQLELHSRRLALLPAVSQRDYTQYYQHILKQEEQICQAVEAFFSQHIQYNFLDEDFVFDVYRDSQGRVWLIDLNPFGEVTDSLLFSWEELTSGDLTQQQEGPAFRYATSEVTVQPSPCLSYRIPRDFVDLSTGEDAYKLIDFLKLKKSQQEDSEEEEEERGGDAPPQ
ncbi:Cell division cycle protein 123 -like protein [Takifugu flavidus]|uniref:Translation initiation factor eIF2 assembly protein n=1 Tax=Takifugu flavidus TaxID=433684 RepID=A0A5C6NC33_9TELE|nr:Cell division cycle protein 123 -like protein [Takifugu flavidus]